MHSNIGDSLYVMDKNTQQEFLDEIAKLNAVIEEQRSRLISQATRESSDQVDGTLAAVPMTPAPTSEENRAICRVSAKLPPFWAEKPALWFAQIESQFLLAGISKDSTKYHHVVANLDARFASEVEDIITSPPDIDAYKYLKEELIRRLSGPQEQRIRRLLDQEELGDRKPSHFLRHLKSLAAGAVELTDPLLRSLWLQRLPPHVQAILQVQGSLPLEKMADVADRILEVQGASHSGAVNAVVRPAVTEEVTRRIEDQLQALSRQVVAFRDALPSTAGGRFRRSRSQRRPSPGNRVGARRSTSHSPVRADRLCFYHRKFGNGARRCESPCSFPENPSGSY